ncbi:MAG: ATP-binding protein [Alphaproteobacteria bacterium]|nr:ATP-binding protein [Alphaproteobacteria bacterium]
MDGRPDNPPPLTAEPDAARTRHTYRLQQHMVLLVLIAILPLGLISGAIVAQHAMQERRDFRDQLTGRADTMAVALDREIEVITAALSVMATTSALEPGGDRSAFNAKVRTVEATFNNVMVVHERDEMARPTTPEALRQVFAQGRPGVGRPSERGAPLVPGLPVYEPVIQGERTVAVLEMGLTEAQISTVLANQNRGRDVLAMLLDPGGTIIGAAGRGAPAAGGMAPSWLAIAPVGEPEDALRFGDWEDGRSRVCAAASPERARHWSIAICELRDSYEDGWLAPLRERGITLFGSLLLGITAATAAARRFVLPLERLTTRARGVASRREERTSVPASAVTEFEDLRISVREAESALRRQATSEHLAMLEARTAQRLLTSVINGVTEGIVVKDLAGGYVMMNQAARRDLVTGAGEDAADMLAEDAAVIAAITTRSFEIAREIGGVTRQLALTKTPWRDATGAIAGVVTVARDVTEARARETRLRVLQAELLHTTRLSSMAAMTSGLAHEINQPLAAAANFLSASLRLFDRAADDAPTRTHARAAIEDAKAQVLRAGAIVRRLRDFVARGEGELQEESVRDVIEEARALARADGADRGVPIALSVGPDAGRAMLDRTQMQQVLLNLIRNAAEAITARPGGAAQDDRITLAATRDSDGRAVIRISDTGPGIPPGIAARLFQPFVSTKSDGLGIGLAICHTIIVGHGGQLLHDTNTGGGAQFTILLPTLTLEAESAA